MSERYEDHYEVIELVVRSREDGQTWFDIIFDLISEGCELNPTESGCSCGLESMGGSGGTLEQCYNWSNGLAAGISPIMVARALVALSNEQGDYDNVRKCLDWALKEIKCEEYFENRKWGDEDEEDDEEEDE